jgi:hypothetical protein
MGASTTPSMAVKRPASDEELEAKPSKVTKKTIRSTPTKKTTTTTKQTKKITESKLEGKAEAAVEASKSTPLSTEGPRYWLFKSEPETRITPAGHDVRFSIDDLIASRDSTAPWDGVRNYTARNNLKDMRLGDLGFFYHSNCKEPGIVGIVEVVQEAVPDGDYCLLLSIAC